MYDELLRMSAEQRELLAKELDQLAVALKLKENELQRRILSLAESKRAVEKKIDDTEALAMLVRKVGPLNAPTDPPIPF